MSKVILTEEQAKKVGELIKTFGKEMAWEMAANKDREFNDYWEALNELTTERLSGAIKYGYRTKEQCVQELEKKADDLNDNVNKPNHYTTGKYEVIDYIQDKLTPEQYVGYCMGNVIKYTSRWQHKNGVEDLKKAKVYLEWAINELEGEGNE